jgi:8-oxo-dGTP pyrophosphatase MutT (NUDIX family)
MRKIVPNDAVLIPDHAEKVFAGKIYDVYQWQQALFDGTEATFEMLKRPDTVQAICVIEDKILVLKEEQPHSGLKLSFPGGRVDPDDSSALEATKREVHEETGRSFKNWKLIAVKQPHTKIEWFIHTFLAWDEDGQDEPHLDPGEKIEITYAPFERVKELADQGLKYIHESQELLHGLHAIQDLLQLELFAGQDVNR